MYRYNSLSRGGICRSRKGILLGVCRGLGEYFGFSVFWIRATAVILFIFTGFWPVVGIYILAALLMKSEPADHSGAGCRPPGGSRYRRTRNDADGRLKRKWEHLERRLRNMEAKVTSREFDWNRRFHGN